MINYHAITLDVSDDDALDRVINVACSIPGYYRIYIEENRSFDWTLDCFFCQYEVEILFTNEQDITLFNLQV
jgi:hypothetical protein